MQKKFEYLLCISLFLIMVIVCILMYMTFAMSIDYEPVIIPQIEPIPHQKASLSARLLLKRVIGVEVKELDKFRFVGMTQNRSLQGGLRENRKR